jgi:hypothetical protein
VNKPLRHPPVAAPRKTLVEIMRATIGDEAAASYRPSRCRPSASDITASAHDTHMAGLIHDMAVGYASKGHRP